MKQTVFRKVYVKDRLPVSFGEYITDIGYMFYNNGQKYFEDRQGVGFPEWFFEEIEMPTEKDIYTLSSRCATNERMNGFEEGANYILNKLK